MTPFQLRSRLRDAARQVAIRALGMEFDTEERDPAAHRRGDPSRFDPSKIPPLVDGDGDTPGPNHRSDIGRTWVSAQLVGGVAPVFVDIRPPMEVVAGVLPGAVLAPGRLILDRLHLLPADQGVRVTVYDQTGELGSADVAQALRDAGYAGARRLVGGYAEWIEQDEPIRPPPGRGALRVGDPARLVDGREGHLLAFQDAAGRLQIELWLPDGRPSGWVDADALVG
jgi:rhodanese-related sulfurtransferase